MFNPDFYPTPNHLAAKMAGMIDPAFSKRILEPSAGKGDLVKAIDSRLSRYGKKVECIEKEPELRSLLTGEGYKVVDTDFLAYSSTKQYDTIIMNPPFSNGDKHVLKAWEIIYNGDVIALLNAETLKNAHSESRKLLVDLIERYGEVEYLENQFIDAERKTGVEVALIHLRKRNSINSDYFQGMKQANREYEQEAPSNQLAIPENRIENMVLAFSSAVDSKRKACIADAEASYYSNLIKGEGKDKTEQVKQSLNEFVDDLRESAWREVVKLTDFRKYLTERVRIEFESQIDIVKNLEFTTENVKAFLKNLVASYDSIIDDCIEDVFDLMTKYYPENRAHIEGWKSNDYFFVGKRVVLPNMNSGFHNKKVAWEKERLLDDIDRAMAHLSGLQQEVTQITEEGRKVKKAGYSKVSTMLNDEQVAYGQAVESEFFKARIYMKGTVHLYFKDLKLLEKFNLTVGRKRNWLPKQDKRVPDEFWLMHKAAA
jgi:hypothetical protein